MVRSGIFEGWANIKKGNCLCALAGLAWVVIALLLASNNSGEFTFKTVRNLDILLALGSVILISLFTFLLPVERSFRERRSGLLIWQYLAGSDRWALRFRKSLSLLSKPALFLLFPAVFSVITWKWQGGAASAPMLVYIHYLLLAYFFICLGSLSVQITGSWTGSLYLPYFFVTMQLYGVFLIASLMRSFPFLESLLNPALWINPLFWLSEPYQFDLVRWNLIYQSSSLGGYRFTYPPTSFTLLFLLILLGLSFLMLWAGSKEALQI